MSSRRIDLAPAAALALGAGEARAECPPFTGEMKAPPGNGLPPPDPAFIDPMPSNWIFVDPNGSFPGKGGSKLDLVVDHALTDDFCRREWIHDPPRVERIADPTVAAGRRFDCSGCDGLTGFSVLAEADEDPPSQVVVTHVSVTLMPTSEDAFGEPRYDFMTLELDVGDDWTPQDDLILVGYFADDQQALAATSDPEVVWSPRTGGTSPLRTVHMLGWGGIHDRDGLNFRRSDPYCFSIAAMDRAGNEGPRSEAVCLDTDDPSDPLVDASWTARGRACTFARSAGSGLGTTALLWALLLLPRRRHRSGP